MLNFKVIGQAEDQKGGFRGWVVNGLILTSRYSPLTTEGTGFDFAQERYRQVFRTTHKNWENLSQNYLSCWGDLKPNNKPTVFILIDAPVA